MAMEWKKIDEAKAKGHRLYGIRGWLLFYLITHLIGTILLVSVFGKELKDADLQIPGIIKAFYYFCFAGGATIVWSGFAKSKLFRPTAIGIHCALPLALITAGLQAPNTEPNIAAILTTLLVSATWVSYLQFSRRVRVTFEHAVRRDDPLLRPKAEFATQDQTGPGLKLSASLTLGRSNGAATFEAEKSVSKAVNDQPDEAVWAAALNEYESSERKAGLYAKCFAQANGNEAIAKAQYIQQRASEIHADRSRMHLSSSETTSLQSPVDLNFPDERIEASSAPVSAKPLEKYASEKARLKPFFIIIALLMATALLALFGVVIGDYSPKEKQSKSQADKQHPPVVAEKPSNDDLTGDKVLSDFFGKKPVNGLVYPEPTKMAKVWFGQKFKYQDEEYLVVFIKSYNLKDGGVIENYHAAGPSISASTYKAIGGDWIPSGKQKDVFSIGTWGETEDISMVDILKLSEDTLGFQFTGSYSGQGHQTGFVAIVGFSSGKWRQIGVLDTSGDNAGACDSNAIGPETEQFKKCWKFNGTVNVQPGNNNGLAPLTVKAVGTVYDQDRDLVVNAGLISYKYNGKEYIKVGRS